MRETLIALARDALGRAVRVPAVDPRAELAHLDELVDRGGRREAALRAHLLRHSLAAHLAVAATTGAPPDARDASPLHQRVDGLLDELLDVVAEHGLSLFGVDAQALVARRALLADDEDTALASLSTALSHLDEPVVVDHAPTVREHRRNLQSSYRLVAGSLASLGMHEVATPLVERARSLADEGGDRLGVATCDYEQVRITASWGLRLQRAGRDGGERLREAADAATTLATEDAGLLPDDHRPLLRAAGVLGRTEQSPVPCRAARRDAVELGRMAVGFPSLHDHLLTELARARALRRAGRIGDAATALEHVQRRRPRGEPSLLLSVTRELAGLRSDLAAGCDAPAEAAKEALREYTAQLEAELWSLHQARVMSLRARVAHDRLRREHGRAAAQARSDPLTGLPNRRALDEFLDGTLACRDGSPVAVAMVDVDRFKRVNDVLSHAHGDEVLRLVAGALRRSLRSDDMVARYGGDEFVVVLPGTTATAGAAALGRAVRSVRSLSDGTARDAPGGEGVTLSIGVVTVGAEEDARAALERADAAMYGVKRRGGDAVHVPPDPPGPGSGGGPPEAVGPRP